MKISKFLLLFIFSAASIACHGMMDEVRSDELTADELQELSGYGIELEPAGQRPETDEEFFSRLKGFVDSDSERVLRGALTDVYKANMEIGEGETLLEYVVKKGAKKCFNLLLSKDGDDYIYLDESKELWTQFGEDGITILHIVAAADDSWFFKELMEESEEKRLFFVMDYTKDPTVLNYAIERSQNLEWAIEAIVKELKKEGETAQLEHFLNIRDSKGNAALHYLAKRAVSKGHTSESIFFPYWAKLLVKNGANPMAKGYRDQTPLHILAKGRGEGANEMAKALLLGIKDPSVAKVYTYDKDGNTPLHIAAALGNFKLFDLFLKDGSVPERENLNEGLNALEISLLTLSDYLLSRNYQAKDIVDKQKIGFLKKAFRNKKKKRGEVLKWLVLSVLVRSRIDEYEKIIKRLIEVEEIAVASDIYKDLSRRFKNVFKKIKRDAGKEAEEKVKKALGSFVPGIFEKNKSCLIVEDRVKGLTWQGKERTFSKPEAVIKDLTIEDLEKLEGRVSKELKKASEIYLFDPDADDAGKWLKKKKELKNKKFLIDRMLEQKKKEKMAIEPEVSEEDVLLGGKNTELYERRIAQLRRTSAEKRKKERLEKIKEMARQDRIRRREEAEKQEASSVWQKDQKLEEAESILKRHREDEALRRQIEEIRLQQSQKDKFMFDE